MPAAPEVALVAKAKSHGWIVDTERGIVVCDKCAEVARGE